MMAALGVFLAPRFGWRVDAVYSGSMEPEFMAGDVVITQPVQTTKIEEGDVITYRSPRNNEMTSHRVTAIDNGPVPGFHTKGDANEDTDPYLVPAANIVGRVCFSIPFFGRVTGFIKTPKGLILTLCLPGSIIVAMELVNIWRVVSDRGKRKKYRFAVAYGHESEDLYKPETVYSHQSMNKNKPASFYDYEGRIEYRPVTVHYYQDRREYRQMPSYGREGIRERQTEPESGNKDRKKKKNTAGYNQIKKRKYRNRFEKKYAKYLART